MKTIRSVSLNMCDTDTHTQTHARARTKDKQKIFHPLAKSRKKIRLFVARFYFLSFSVSILEHQIFELFDFKTFRWCVKPNKHQSQSQSTNLFSFLGHSAAAHSDDFSEEKKVVQRNFIEMIMTEQLRLTTPNSLPTALATAAAAAKTNYKRYH